MISTVDEGIVIYKDNLKRYWRERDKIKKRYGEKPQSSWSSTDRLYIQSLGITIEGMKKVLNIDGSEDVKITIEAEKELDSE